MSLVAVLDVPLLVAVFAGDGFSLLADSAPLVVAGNAAVIGMLWRARTSIARTWSKDHERIVDRPL